MVRAIKEKTKPAKVVFGQPAKRDFYSTVKQRVDTYFQKQGISRHADLAIKIKTTILFALYFISYGAIMSNAFTGIALIGWFSLLGLVMSLFGFNFSHDVMHGSFFKSPKWNYFWSYFFDFNGTSSFVWKYSHNVQHHTYTNIPGFDEDIDKAIILRLSPQDKLYPFHRYQVFYAPFLYAFTSLNWACYADFVGLYRRMQKGSIPKKEIFLFFALKIAYFTTFLFLPLALLSAPAWQIFLGFFCLHFTGGFISAIVFQLAHVVEGVDFPCPSKEGEIKEPWATHEMKTTSNFATNNRVVAQLVGGLNFQIEHHLFTPVCHTHYFAISPIVRETAKEFGLPYHEHPTVSAALLSHLRMLKQFGRK